jgi:hypothetical protein
LPELPLGFQTENESMSPFSRGLVALAVAVAGSQARNLISRIELDSLLKPMGLERRRQHWGTTMAILGTGVVVGTSAVLLLAPSAASSIRERFAPKLEGTSAKPGNAQPERANVGTDKNRSTVFHGAP